MRHVDTDCSNPMSNTQALQNDAGKTTSGIFLYNIVVTSFHKELSYRYEHLLKQ